jgi:hypothetical protein
MIERMRTYLPRRAALDIVGTTMMISTLNIASVFFLLGR